MRRATVAVALIAAAAVAATFVVHRSTGSSRATPSAARSFTAQARDLPAPEQPAFKVGIPKLLDRHESRARFAPVKHAVEARSAPSARARPVAFIGLFTPEGTDNIVEVIGERSRPSGLWVDVRLAVLPNDSTGWVPRRALGGYHFVQTHLVIDRQRFTATLYDEGRKVFAAPIGVGKVDSPTPGGQFYIRDRVSGFGDAFYGPIAFGTSARSAVLTDWPAGGYVGVHGTNEPGLIPGRISHGCIRLRNPDIVRLSRLMPVGTPVTIR